MNRKIEIEILRIVSIFMIIILHLNNYGFNLFTLESGSFLYNLSWILEGICLCGVNIFGLVSGYVMIYNKTNIEKILLLCEKVCIYTFFSLIGIIFFTCFHLEKNVIIDEIITMFLSIFTGKYWYFTAYVFLYLLIPFINRFIFSLKKMN